FPRNAASTGTALRPQVARYEKTNRKVQYDGYINGSAAKRWRWSTATSELADINYLRKTAALFNEFRETGMSDKLKYRSAADLRANYPNFFWQVVRPYIEHALRYLRVTQEGQMWIAALYANVFSTEHRGQIN